MCKRYLRDFSVQQGVFAVKLLNDVREILKRQTLVAMATKLGQNGHNLTCMGNINKMFAPSRGFGGWAIERRQTNSTPTNPVAMATKI